MGAVTYAKYEILRWDVCLGGLLIEDNASWWHTTDNHDYIRPLAFVKWAKNCPRNYSPEGRFRIQVKLQEKSWIPYCQLFPFWLHIKYVWFAYEALDECLTINSRTFFLPDGFLPSTTRWQLLAEKCICSTRTLSLIWNISCPFCTVDQTFRMWSSDENDAT